MLQTKQLHFQYANGPEFHFPDLVCNDGERLLIIGESGKGKTTLLHLLAGMLQPQSGAIQINGQTTSAISGAALDKFRGKNVGIVFQTAHFVESLSVVDNLILPQYLTGNKVDRSFALQVLGRLGLADKSNKKPSQLSVGEQQRAAIARAVMNKPAVILADEPTSALDDKNAKEVIRLLEEQASELKSSLIIVTHDQRLKDHFSNHLTL